MERNWKEIVKKSQGLIIVSPEYNHSFPGELKILLDSLSDEYERIPVAICGVSIGKFGGACMIDHIKQVLVHLGMIPISLSVNFSLVKEAFMESNLI
jgi:NAD(P)H-dependent FMN reductase